MLIGNIHFKGKEFPAGSIMAAANGLSETTIAGVNTAVLGNDPGAPGEPAQLLSDRVIQMQGFNILFDNNGNGFVRIDATDIVVSSGNLISFRAVYTPDGSATDYTTGEFGGAIFVANTQRGIYIFNDSNPIPGNVRIGLFPSGFADNNGAELQVAGRMTNDCFVSAHTTTPISINGNLDKNKVYTNEGAAALVQFNLPGAAAGRMFEFIVQNANGITIDAAAGDTIRIGTSVTAASGSITSAIVGSTIKLKAINATEWIATSMMGAWTI